MTERMTDEELEELCYEQNDSAIADEARRARESEARLLAEMDLEFAFTVIAAVEAEREECAKVAESFDHTDSRILKEARIVVLQVKYDISAAIRARGGK